MEDVYASVQDTRKQRIIRSRSANDLMLPDVAAVKQRKGWNNYVAISVKRLGQRAGGYKWMHSQSSIFYNRCYQWFGILAAVLNTLSTAGNFPFIVTCQNEFTVLKISALIVQAIVTFAMWYTQFKSFGSRSEAHRNSEANFGALYDQIRAQLQKNSKDRQDAHDYYEWITSELRNLKEASPLIPSWILKRYRILIKDQNVADPEGIDDIMIKKDSPDRTNTKRNVSMPPLLVSDPIESRLEAVVIDDENAFPRFGFLTRTEENAYMTAPATSETTTSTAEKITLERWKDQQE